MHPSCYCALDLLCVIFLVRLFWTVVFKLSSFDVTLPATWLAHFCCCCFQVSVEWQRLLLDYFYAAPRFRQRVRKAIFETGKPTISRFHFLDLSHIFLFDHLILTSIPAGLPSSSLDWLNSDFLYIIFVHMSMLATNLNS